MVRSHSALIALFAIALGTSVAAAQGQPAGQPAAGQETTATPAASEAQPAAGEAAADGADPAAADSAEADTAGSGDPDAADSAAADPAAAGDPAAAAAAPAPSCDGMIDPARLTDACDAKLRNDAEWRVGLGTELSSRIMCAVKNRKGRKVDTANPDEDPCAEVKIEPWLSEIAENLNHEVHQQELESIQQNNRHVIMAYSALWIIMIGFVAFMWTRQKQLRDEIAHLQTELAEATRDD